MSASDILSQLPLLYAQLRAVGFALAADTCLAMEDLLARLMVGEQSPPQPQNLAEYLAPVICRNPEQQRDFYRIYDDWLKGIKPDAMQPPPSVKPVNQAIEQRRRFRTSIRQWLAIGAMVFGLILGLYIDSLFQPSFIVVTKTTIANQTNPTNPDARVVEVPQVNAPKILPIPPRTPPLAIALSEQRLWLLQKLRWSALALPWVLFSLWLVLGLIKRQVTLKKLNSEQADPFLQLVLQLNSHHPFSSAQLMPPLRAGVRQVLRQLNIRRTLLRTLHKGLFTPVLKTRQRRPEYLILVARSSTHDHRAALAWALVDQLRHQDLTVQAFEYRHNPAMCYRPGQKRGISLRQLAEEFPHARLIITGDAQGLFHPLTGAPYPLVADLTHWQCRIWMTTRATPWGQREAELAHTGFVVAPLTGDGLQSIGRWLKRPEPGLWFMDPREHALPRLLQEEPERWLREVPPPDFDPEEFLHSLRIYLGPSGFTLLSACAAYPQMVGNLAIALDEQLFVVTGDKHAALQAREQRLLKLARLPWNQSGYMPLYLRRLLHDNQTKTQKKSTALAYETLFTQATLTQEFSSNRGLFMPFTSQQRKADRRRRRLLGYLRDLCRFSPRGNPLSDTLFAELMFSRSRRLLDFLLPKNLARRLSGKRWGWSRIWIASGWATIAAAILHLGWPGIQDPLTEWQMRRMITVNQNTPVRIEHTEETAVLAQHLRNSLTLWGFQNIELRQNATLSNDAFFGPSSAGEQINIVRDLLRHITYDALDLAATFSAEMSLVEIALASPLKPLAVFRDPLVNPFNPEQWQAELESLQKQIAAESVKPSLEETAGNYEIAAEPPEPPKETQIHILQDRLKIGAPGPRMVVIPAGTFLMGSPESEPGRKNDEGPQRKVTVAAFALGETEVTFAEYDRYAKAVGARLPEDCCSGRDQFRGPRPVINVSWQEAIVYARWLSDQTGAQYRLPTEAEWEYAARAGTTTPFSTGYCINSQQANFTNKWKYGNCPIETSDSQGTTEVGVYLPNSFGLKDMHGNALEWTQDCWHSNYLGAPEIGTAWLQENDGDCSYRVLRGGSSQYGAGYQRSAFRITNEYADVNLYIGFRLARTLRAEEIPHEQSAAAE